MNFQLSVKRALEKTGMKSSEVYNKIGFTRQNHHSRLNANNPEAETLERYADAFGMKVSDFIALGEK